MILNPYAYAAAPGGGLSFVGANSAAATTVAIPAHAAGDLILMFAFDDDFVMSESSVPAGWTLGNGGFVNPGVWKWAYRIAVDGTTTSGTWADADELVCLVYRGIDTADPIGASAASSGSSSTLSYPTITLEVTDGTSWLVGFGGHVSATDMEQAPSGMTNRTAAGTEAAGHDTNGGVAAWSAQTVNVNASGRWVAYVIELRSA